MNRACKTHVVWHTTIGNRSSVPFTTFWDHYCTAAERWEKEEGGRTVSASTSALRDHCFKNPHRIARVVPTGDVPGIQLRVLKAKKVRNRSKHFHALRSVPQTVWNSACIFGSIYLYAASLRLLKIEQAATDRPCLLVSVGSSCTLSPASFVFFFASLLLRLRRLKELHVSSFYLVRKADEIY